MSGWNARCEELPGSPGGVRVYLRLREKPLHFFELLQLLTDSDPFADWYSELLRETGPRAFFWEHPPLTHAGLENQVEFVMLDAPALARRRPDHSSFAGQFAAARNGVAVFDSLGGDARLLAPCPPTPDSDYAHFGAFLRNAPATQIRALWQHTGREVSRLLSTEPLWLSTSGLGVSWLHIRLDTRPKYYQHRPYKTF